MSSTIHEVIASRRTISQYQPEPIDPKVIERALTAAHQAPCHKRTWPWRFHQVGPKTRQRLVDIAGGESTDVERTKKLEAKILNPGALIVVSQVLDPDPFRRKEDYAACAAGIQNAMLSFTADGLGSKWGSGSLTREPATYAALGIDSATEEIIGFLWAGVPRIHCPEPPRPPLSQVTRVLP